MGSTGSFSGPRISLTFDGLLFDFDGTIVDSTAGEPPLHHAVLPLTSNVHFPPKLIMRF